MKKILKWIAVAAAAVLLSAGLIVFREIKDSDIKVNDVASEEELVSVLMENFTTGYESVYVRMKDFTVEKDAVGSYISAEIANDAEDLSIMPVSYTVNIYEYFDVWKFQLYYADSDSVQAQSGDAEAPGESSAQSSGTSLSYTAGEVEEAGRLVSEALDVIVPEIRNAGDAGDEAAMHRAIFEYLCDHVTYDKELSNVIVTGDMSSPLRKNRGSYGALIEGRTVCSGYAAAYKAICDRLGLDCWVAESQEHAWNLVLIDGQVYCVDATSGDQDTWIADQFFMISPEDYEQEYGYRMSARCYLPERFRTA